MLSERELARYERQMLISGWNKEGQEKLKASKVVVAGAGGLGSVVSMYLALAGVGELRIIDGDLVELGNLNRQILHADKDLGTRKVDSAVETLTRLNPDISVEAIGETITEANVFDLADHHPIVDAMDNLPARLLLNKVAVTRSLPIFHGAVYGFEGRVTTIVPTRTPCMRCLYRDVVPGPIPVAGVTPGVIGCIQATEAIKHLLGLGELLLNRMIVYDGLSLTFRELTLKRDPRCEECGT